MVFASVLFHYFSADVSWGWPENQLKKLSIKSVHNQNSVCLITFSLLFSWCQLRLTWKSAEKVRSLSKQCLVFASVLFHYFSADVSWGWPENQLKNMSVRSVPNQSSVWCLLQYFFTTFQLISVEVGLKISWKSTEKQLEQKHKAKH